MVVGAILAFAVADNWDVVDLTLVGYILLGAGFIVTVLALIFMTKKTTAVSTTRSNVDPVSGEGVTQNERTIS